MIWVNQLRWSSAQPCAAQSHPFCIPVRTADLRFVQSRKKRGVLKFLWCPGLCLVFMSALAVPANSDVSPTEPGKAATKVAAVNARQLLEQAPQTEFALNALKVELGPRRDKLISMQRDLKAHLEQFKHTSQGLPDADRSAVHEALDSETQTFQRTAQEFQDDASSRRDRELGKVRRFITHEIESYAANNGYKAIAQYEGEVPHGELDVTKKIHAILLEKPRQLPASEAYQSN